MTQPQNPSSPLAAYDAAIARGVERAEASLRDHGQEAAQLASSGVAGALPDTSIQALVAEGRAATADVADLLASEPHNLETLYRAVEELIATPWDHSRFREATEQSLVEPLEHQGLPQLHDRLLDAHESPESRGVATAGAQVARRGDELDARAAQRARAPKRDLGTQNHSPSKGLRDRISQRAAALTSQHTAPTSPTPRRHQR